MRHARHLNEKPREEDFLTRIIDPGKTNAAIGKRMAVAQQDGEPLELRPLHHASYEDRVNFEARTMLDEKSVRRHFDDFAHEEIGASPMRGLRRQQESGLFVCALPA